MQAGQAVEEGFGEHDPEEQRWVLDGLPELEEGSILQLARTVIQMKMQRKTPAARLLSMLSTINGCVVMANGGNEVITVVVKKHVY